MLQKLDELRNAVLEKSLSDDLPDASVLALVKLVKSLDGHRKVLAGILAPVVTPPLPTPQKAAEAPRKADPVLTRKGNLDI